MAIAFDPKSHVYRVNGSVRSSVTQLLKRAGYIDSRFYTPDSAEYGKYIHHVTAAIDTRRRPSAYDLMFGEVRAYQKFVNDLRPHYVLIEKPCCDARGIVCGTPDRIFDRWLGPSAGRGVLEIKTGTCADWHGYQTAGYAYIVGDVQSRWCLHLKPNGTYRLHRHAKSIDRARFLHALHTYGETNA